jgi:hypothetical protein
MTRAMSASVALVVLLSIGCNAILGNDNFRGPGGVADASGDGSSGDACTGIGCMVANCASRSLPPTSLSGTVFAPDGALPMYNAVVYVPGAPLDPLLDGPANPACVSGAPVALTRTDVSGRFKLDNVPTVRNLPVVIQLGKWRREITVSTVNDCADLALPASETRLPRTTAEGHLPRIAVTTGFAECLECLVRKVGVADSEFSSGTGTGRVQLYTEPDAFTLQVGGASIEAASALQTRMMQYDILLFSCDGTESIKQPAVQQILLDYVNAGGWAWLSHLQARWVAPLTPPPPPPPFPRFAQFDFLNTVQPPASVMARIDTATPKGRLFADWMNRVGAASSDGVMTVSFSRNTCFSVDPALAQRQIFLDPPLSSGFSGVQLFSWSAGNRGKVVFSDMHLEMPNTAATTFPGECPAEAFTPQAKMIAFQLFDQPTCVP